MYTIEQEEMALREYERLGSVAAVIQKLGYPSESTLYRWYEHKKAGLENRHGQIAETTATMDHHCNTPGHPRHPSAEFKYEVLLRCFELGGEYENVAILVAIAVNEDGYREVLGAAEGMKEDKASWVSFFQWLRGRGLDGVRLIVGDKCLGMLEAVGEVFPEAKYLRCTVHFYRNVFSVVPRSKVKLVAKMLKAIHAQKSKKASREKAKAMVDQLRETKRKEAAKKVEDSVEETLSYCEFPYEHWKRIRTNNVIERLNREIRPRTRVVGTFPDGNSALMLVCARLRHVAGTQWGNKKYMNMKHLEAALEDTSIAG